MLRRLRISLTILYTLIAVVFMTVLIAVTYGLLAYYFQTITDLALRHKMAHEFQLLGLPLPADLAFADQEWNQIRRQIWPQLPFEPENLSIAQIQANWQKQLAHLNYHLTDQSLEETYDSELAAVFLIPLDGTGQMINAGTALASLVQSQLPEQDAVQAAIKDGQDLRTTVLTDGTRVRLLTYRLNLPDGGAFFQLGRLLTDQDYILRRFLNGLLFIGGVGALVSAVGSWWLAGRSLRPVQESIERQRIFVANASHELRTPLTLIRASAEVAHDNAGPNAENRALLADIMLEVDHMTRLVDDLLLLSRIDAGKLELQLRPVDLAELVHEAQRQCNHLAESHRVQFTVERASGAVLADPTRLHQVLLILLDNAVRYSRECGVVKMAALQLGADVYITVADNGPGIPADYLERIFDRFSQADPSRNGHGAGLGLSIAKALVEAHHGTINVESQEGIGTTVTVTLPALESLSSDIPIQQK
jgi:signal transduction histidine kinase